MTTVIPKGSYGHLINNANNQTQYARVTDYEVHANRLFHKLEYILKDGSVYGGGSVDLDASDKYFSFQIEPVALEGGDEEAVCADHD